VGWGKTELVVEFAHRFRSDYDITWWIPAEQPVTAAAALAALATKLGVPSSADQGAAIAGLFEVLRGRDRWLLIYDNAEKPTDLAGLQPEAGTGSVLVTSRWSGWGRSAEPLRVDVLARAESVQLLSVRTGRTDPEGFAELAALVGDLPLALEEAAAYLEQTGIGLAEYLALLRGRAADMFGLTADASVLVAAGTEGDQRRVSTVWSVSLDAVTSTAPAAGELLQLCAFLAPTIPRGLLSAHAVVVTESLAGSSLGAVVGDAVGYNNTLGVVRRYSLAELTPAEIGVHRLVQAVIRARLAPDREREIASCAVAVLRAAFPNDSWETMTWADCELLLPQVLAVCEHAERLSVAGQPAGWLLDRASTYLRERGQYRQARPLAERAVALTEVAVGPDHVDALWRRDELAQALWELGDYQAALAQSERVVQIGEQTLGLDHPTIGVWRSNLGLVLRALGDLAGARTQLERALQISEQALGPDHPHVGVRRGNLGSVLRALGDLAGARTQFDRALQIGEQALGAGHPHVGIWRSNLGLVLRDLGDLAAARTQFERALQISEQALGPDHPDVGIWRNNLGFVLWDLGDLAGARAEFERALQIGEQALGPDHPTIGIRRGNLGGVLQDLGDLAGARTQFERALQIGEQALGPDHAQTRTIRERLDGLPPL
jgi:tetratricopeptide (TPR) repeat protein